MRVLAWTDWYLPSIGGVEVFLARLLPALVRHGHEVTVVAGHHCDGLPDEVCLDGVRVRRFPFHAALAAGDVRRIADLLRGVSDLKRALAPDLVHLNTLGPSVLFHLHSTRAHPVPVLLTLHSPLGEGSVAPETLAGRALRSSTRVNCNSHALHADLRRCLPGVADRSAVVHYGMDPPALRPGPPPRGAPRVLVYGRMVRDKGFDLALRAFASVVRRWPDARLVLAGDGAERPALERLAADLGLSAVVDFAGLVPPDRVPALLDAANVVVVPSRWDEPFGLVALEAALMERPVVAARVGGLVEVVADGETGLLVAREDPDALAGAVLRLLADPAEAERLGRAARARARERFSWAACVGAYERLYESTREEHHE